MFIVKLAIKNRMADFKSLFSNFHIMGPISLAVTIPWIMLKMFSAAWLKKGYNELVGKVVVITGASSGLGEALCHEFYKNGAQVVLCARRRQELERVRTDLLHSQCKNTTHSPIIIPMDISENNFDNHIEKILSITGRIDILINNAGISVRSSVKDTKVDVERKIMAVNYFGTVSLTKAILIDMLKKKQGHIVFISSVQGLIAIPDRAAYGASKHALQAFADSLRAEVASDNIYVSVISPGYVKTQLSMNALTGNGQSYGKMDKSTETGYSAEYAAEETVKCIVRKQKELILCTFWPKLVVFLRRFWPFLYFILMERRAKKSSFANQVLLKRD